VDWDGDGRPAATVAIRVPVLGSIELYVAQRAHVRLEGQTDAGTGVTRGAVDFEHFEQRTLGASHRMFEANPDMWPDPARSGFELRRIAPGAGCAEARESFPAD
ncbi:MAG: hypothetical protein VX000_02295, partial [Myxococcota bacterium]|nr:hypothetical protein [Myxococcota bacterium]